MLPIRRSLSPAHAPNDPPRPESSSQRPASPSLSGERPSLTGLPAGGARSSEQTTAPRQASLPGLPAELRTQIFSYLPLEDADAFASTSRLLRTEFADQVTVQKLKDYITAEVWGPAMFQAMLGPPLGAQFPEFPQIMTIPPQARFQPLNALAEKLGETGIPSSVRHPPSEEWGARFKQLMSAVTTLPTLGQRMQVAKTAISRLGFLRKEHRLPMLQGTLNFLPVLRCPPGREAEPATRAAQAAENEVLEQAAAALCHLNEAHRAAMLDRINELKT